MRIPCTTLLLVLLSAAPSSHGAAAAAPRPIDRYRGADALAGEIDRHLESGWVAAGIVPARAADDAEFVRRVTLDLAGRIPSVAEVRAFLADRRPNRRALLVERLLAGPRYVTHFTQVWRALLLPEASVNFQVRFQVPGFETWLRDGLTRDRGYDAMVRELLTTPLGDNRMAQGLRPEGNPAAFYSAKDFKPEEIASATARLFLGVNVGCAQCHNHPFASWNREQFWSFAAFFAGIKSRREGDFAVFERETPNTHELTIPGTEKVAQARYLDGTSPQWKFSENARATLANWMTARDNPYFARAVVNRLWAHLLGTGITDPVDDMEGGDARPSHPAVLDALARAFIAHDYDLKFLIRAITATRAYQLTSARSHPTQDAPRQFARMPLRGLTGEQLLDSLIEATGFAETNQAEGLYRGFGPSPRQLILTKFTDSRDRPTEVQTSILQALTLMNGPLTRNATSLTGGLTLAAVSDAPFLDTAGRIETLYLATLSRPPSARELARSIAYIDRALAAAPVLRTDTAREKRYREALADVFWALLNSGEFFLNH